MSTKTDTTNAYLQFLISQGELLLQATPHVRKTMVRQATYSHWDPQNEWVHAEFANLLLIGAFLYTHPGNPWHQSQRLHKWCHLHLDALLDAAVDNRWYHGQPRMGDKNIDRFTGIAFLEAHQLFAKFMTSLQHQRVEQLVKHLMLNQYNEYGSGNNALQDQARFPGGRRLYANMDACYALMMAHGYRITGQSQYLEEARLFVHQLEKAQYDDGAWSYIDQCNECFGYHGLDLLALTRVAQIIEDKSAWDQLRKSIPYYPMTLTPDLIAENHTDVWWKHQWESAQAYGPDVIASLFEDPHNRYIGNELRSATFEKLSQQLTSENALALHTSGFFSVTAARTWQHVTPVKPDWHRVFMDRNIDGPRAHLPLWSWAGTARFACDTLVGAVVRMPKNEPLCALLAVSPEITHRHDEQPATGNQKHALGTTPRDIKSHTTIDAAAQAATFTATYPLASFRSFWNVDPFPVAWECTQKWTLGLASMTGTITIKSLVDQYSAPPAVRIRLGKHRQLVEGSPGSYEYGPLRVKVDSIDFINRTTRSCSPMPSMTTENSVEIILLTASEWNVCAYAQGQTFKITVEVRLAC